MGVKVKPKMSKKAAMAAAAKGKPKPASKKAAKLAKQKKQKPGKVQAIATVIPAIDVDALNRDANANESKLQEMIPEHVACGAEIYNVMADHMERQLWKYGDTPYASKEAFITHYAELAKISTRTLKAVMSANKFLPGVTAETKKRIGPRKLKKVVAAVKKHRAKTGNPEAEPPAEIIEAAIEQPEAKFDETLRAADLAPESASTAHDAGGASTVHGLEDNEFVNIKETHADPLLHQDKSEQPFRRNKKQASGVVEGAHGDAQQFSSVIEQAVAAQQLIEPELAKIDALELIAKQWLKFPCVREDLQDMTNEQAAEHLSGGPKKGKRK